MRETCYFDPVPKIAIGMRMPSREVNMDSFREQIERAGLVGNMHGDEGGTRLFVVTGFRDPRISLEDLQLLERVRAAGPLVPKNKEEAETLAGLRHSLGLT